MHTSLKVDLQQVSSHTSLTKDYCFKTRALFLRLDCFKISSTIELTMDIQGRGFMTFGIWQVVIITFALIVLFGRNRVSDLMKDLGKGIKAFKKEIDEKDAPKQLGSRDNKGNSSNKLVKTVPLKAKKAVSKGAKKVASSAEKVSSAAKKVGRDLDKDADKKKGASKSNTSKTKKPSTSSVKKSTSKPLVKKDSSSKKTKPQDVKPKAAMEKSPKAKQLKTEKPLKKPLAASNPAVKKGSSGP